MNDISSQVQWPQIPGYTILEKIGQGSMGTVYRARQEALDRQVAIKVLHPKLAEKKRYLQRLQREAKLTAQLDHPNVVKGIDYGTVAAGPYFVMEFAQGESLRAVLKRRGRFPEKEAIQIALQIAGALEKAYQHGIVHRDVKPGNVVLSVEGKVKLTDLGLARRPGDPTITHTGGTVGTPQYISPEQARDPSNVDVRSDIYSLGATIYHLVTGSPPFAGESLADLLTKVLFEHAEDPSFRVSTISEGFSLVLRKMLAKDPDLRYQTPSELVRDLKRVQANIKPEVKISEVGPQLDRKKIMAGLAMGLLVVTAAIWYWPGQEKIKEESKIPAENRVAFNVAQFKPDETLESSAWMAKWSTLNSHLSDPLDDFALRKTLEGYRNEWQRLLNNLWQKSLYKTGAKIKAMIRDQQYRAASEFIDSEAGELIQNESKISLADWRNFHGKNSKQWAQWLIQQKSQLYQAALESLTFFDRRFRERWDVEIKTITQKVAVNQFVSALQSLNEFLGNFESLQDLTLQEFATFKDPEIRRLTDGINELIQREITRIRAEADDLALKAALDLRQAHSQLAKKLEDDWGKSAELILKEEVKNILVRWNLQVEQLPSDPFLDWSRSVERVRIDLIEIERVVQLRAANIVLRNLDTEFSQLLKQRQYEAVLNEWRKVITSEKLKPVSDELVARIRELEAALTIKQKFGEAVQARKGKLMEIRQGAIWKLGTVVGGYDFALGKFVLKSKTGVLTDYFFRDIDIESIGEIAKITQERSLSVKEDVTEAQKYAWAAVLLYEGQGQLVLTLVEKVLLGKDDHLGFSRLVPRAQLQIESSKEKEVEQEKLAELAFEQMRQLLIVGDWDRAENIIELLLKKYKETQFVRSKRNEFEEELQKIAMLRREQNLLAAWREQFPGAGLFPRSDSSLLLKYEFRNPKPSGWVYSDAYKNTERGIVRVTRCKNAKEFKEKFGPRFQFKLPPGDGLHVEFKIAFPFENGEPFFTCFSVLGHTFGVLSGGERVIGKIANWTGSVDKYDVNFQHPNLEQENTNNSSFRFIRGGVYQVTIDISNQGKKAALKIDGEQMSVSILRQDPGAMRKQIEIRSWEKIELISVAIDGVTGGI